MSKPKVKTIKRDQTLIESLIENSKEIVNLKNAIHIGRMYIQSKSKCKYSLINQTEATKEIKELRGRVKELMIHSANMLKAAYSHQFKMTFNEFLISTPEMQAGFVSFRKGDKQMILFLSDCQPAFLEKMKEGDLVEYSDVIEREYIPNCKAVWHPSSLNDLYLEHVKLFIK